MRSMPVRSAIAVLVSDLLTGTDAPDEIQLLPVGEFRTADGRPDSAPAFRLTSALAEQLIARFAARRNKHVIDFEHQTLHAERNGQPAPAAGWFSGLRFDAAKGLYATGVEWTERARQMIAAKEYRYLSAVFPYDRTGAVLDIYHAGLTNHPAIDGMQALAAARFGGPDLTEETSMNPKLAKLLGLAEGATDDDIIAAIEKLQQQAAEAGKKAADAANAVEALKAKQTPDLKAFAPIAVVEELKTQLATLTARLHDEEVATLVATGLKDGRLLPAQEAWARDLGKTDVAALKTYLDKTPPIDALRRTQTGGKAPGADNAGGLSEQQLAVCKQLGIEPASYQKQIAA
jgi:phage I-like protein